MKSYDAFLSYTRADSAIVDDLYSRLSRFRTPRALARQHTEKRFPRSLSVFLDRKSLQIGGAIPDRLANAIASSRHLIVVCSKDSAKSYWVNEEVNAFLKTSSTENLLPVFLRGTKATQLADLLPPALLDLGDRLPLGADLLIDGGAESVSHKVIGALLNVPQDQVAREQERADKARRRVERIALGVIIVLSTSAAIAGWSAYRQAARAEEALEVSLTALDGTIPLATQLVGDGRIRIEDTRIVDESVVRLANSYSEQGLDMLPDVRFTLGQVMTAGAQLSGASGQRSERLRRARLALDMLAPFLAEPDGSGAVVYCGAALEYARAALDTSQFETAAEPLDACEASAQVRLSSGQANLQYLTNLLVQRVNLRLVRAEAALVGGEPVQALDVLDDRTIDALLAEIEAEARATAQWWTAARESLRGAASATLENYSMAHGHFEAALAAYTAAGRARETMAPLVTSAILAEAGFSGATERGLEQLSLLERDLAVQLEADPGRRDLSLELVHIQLARANLFQDALTEPGPEFGEACSVIFRTREAAAQELARLMLHDRANRRYILAETGRMLQSADFHFRLGEAGPDAATACEKSCFVMAQSRFLEALETLSMLGELTMPDLRLRGAIELRLSRTARLAQTGDAEAWLERAYGTHQEMTEHDGGGSALGEAFLGDLRDEEADLLLELGHADEAAALYEQVAAQLERRLNANPGWSSLQRDLGWTRLRLAEALLAAGEDDRAKAMIAQACAPILEAPARTWLMRLDALRRQRLAAEVGTDCR